MKGFLPALLAACIVGLAGCATKPAPLPLTGDIFRDAPMAIEKGPARDKVLWQYRLALAEMRRGQFDAARPVLDDALLTLGGVYGKDAEARKARRLFSKESKKTFIGEPYERAMAYFYRGILYWRDGQPDNARAQSHLAIAYDSIGATYGSVARWDESLAAYESSSAIFESLSKSHPNSTAYRRNWALERKKIGGALELRGDLARALKEDQFALETDEALAAQSPQDASAQRDVAIDLTNVGDVTSKLGNQTAAIEHYRRALAIDRKLALSDPKDASAQYYLAYDSYHLGDAQLRDAHPREAAVTFQQALARAEKSAHSDPENALLRAEVARIYSRLARAHVAAARLEAAATAAKRQRLTAARASYGKSLAIWSDLKKKGALRGPDLEEPEKVAEELRSCTKEMDEFS